MTSLLQGRVGDELEDYGIGKIGIHERGIPINYEGNRRWSSKEWPLRDWTSGGSACLAFRDWNILKP